MAASERSLSRICRTTLAQLRSGHCRLLRDYQVRVGSATLAVCPECSCRRHTVSLIFDCDAVPTNLSLRDLWDNPGTVCQFLESLPSFLRIPRPNALLLSRLLRVDDAFYAPIGARRRPGTQQQQQQRATPVAQASGCCGAVGSFRVQIRVVLSGHLVGLSVFVFFIFIF